MVLTSYICSTLPLFQPGNVNAWHFPSFSSARAKVSTLYPESAFPSTGGRETSDVRKIRFEVQKYQTYGWIVHAYWQTRGSTKTLVFYFRSFPVFLTNLSQARNGTLSSLSFRQTYAVGSDDRSESRNV